MVIFRGSQIGMKKNPAVFKLIIILFFTLIINNIAFADPQKFSNTIRDIQQYYIYPQSQQKLFDSAIRGMLEGLDPHCAYLNKADLKAMNDTTQSQFAGVGLDVSMEAGLVRVITPLDGSPAQEAGIQSGDYITMIDNTSVTGLTLRAVVHKLRGPQDSQVTLTILKNKASKPFSVVLTRDTIHIQSVKSELFNGVYGYIKLAQFQSSTFKEMMNAINQLKKESLEKNVLQGFILDLRNNSGGLFDAGVAVADAFIDGKQTDNANQTIIVSTKGRAEGSNTTVFAKPGDVLDNIPMIILVNAGSASASEIVAGALKDNNRAIILGTKTFGKGSVQTLIPIGGDSAIKLTTALYYTPSGISIQATGITPNIILKQMVLTSHKSINNNNHNNIPDQDITEANLQGHLTMANGFLTINQPNKSNATKNINNIHSSMAHDYQLQQAINILQGIVISLQVN